MFRNLLCVVCAVRANFWDMEDTPTNSPNGWLENLKKRLMTDNYDYQPSSGEFELRAMDAKPSDAPTAPTPMDTTDTTMNTPTVNLDVPEDNLPSDKQIQFVYDSPEKQVDQNIGLDDPTTIFSMYMLHHQTDDATPSAPQNSIDERDDVDGISRNDVHMYMRNSEAQVSEVPVGVKAKNVSYKVIQPPLLSRRAGGAAPRFVQEVGADGVSLLSVDGAPFPEFQLPSARRQYQAVRDSFSEDWID